MKKTTLLSRILLLFLLVANSSAAGVKKSETVKITVIEGGSEETIPFANVCIIEKGKVVAGNLTDLDGACSFPAENKKRNLKISCIGYTTVEMKIEKGSANLVIRLKKGITLIECMIVANVPARTSCRSICCCTIGTTECFEVLPGGRERNSDADNNTQPSEISVYPNPSNGEFRIKSTFNTFNIDIFDIAGRLVHSVIGTTDETEQNLSFLKPGTYIIRISFGEDQKTTRVIIE